jgi:hypothetical protein
MVYLYDACDQISNFCHQQLLRKMRRKISWTDGRTVNILSVFFLIFCSKCVSQRISHLRLLLWYDIAPRNPFLQNKSTIVYICVCDNFLRHTINVIYIVVNIIIFYHIYDISRISQSNIVSKEKPEMWDALRNTFRTKYLKKNPIVYLLWICQCQYDVNIASDISTVELIPWKLQHCPIANQGY